MENYRDIDALDKEKVLCDFCFHTYYIKVPRIKYKEKVEDIATTKVKTLKKKGTTKRSNTNPDNTELEVQRTLQSMGFLKSEIIEKLRQCKQTEYQGLLKEALTKF